MEPTKPTLFRNILVRLLLFSVLIFAVRFAYVVTIRGETCDLGDFCFFSLPENFSLVSGASGSLASSAVVVTDFAPPKKASAVDNRELWSSKEWIKAVQFYSSVFTDLIAEGFLNPNSKSLCVETPIGQDVFALKEVGVSDSIGISKKASKPLVISGPNHHIPFDENTFDFVFSAGIDRSINQSQIASEISRTLKPEGFLVIHTKSTDEYSFNSFVQLFSCCKLVEKREFNGFDLLLPNIHEIVMKKMSRVVDPEPSRLLDGSKCSVPGYKHQLVRNAEPLIVEEPLKPWITLKKNIQNVKYLPSVADINFKQRYVYVDVGARSYGSSIGSWFRKQYPKQNKTFEVYAIEADKAFHKEYSSKKNVKLLPYAAWLRNETLSFEINHDPGKSHDDQEKGMGRIQPIQSSGSSASNVTMIQGFDFANWLKNTVTEKDFVVMKMDVEGTEFDLIPRLFETGAICLIDEIFLECHYNRWQRCCPGKRSPKYEKTYEQCLDLFSSLRQSGVLVHQWW